MRIHLKIKHVHVKWGGGSLLIPGKNILVTVWFLIIFQEIKLER